MSQIDDRIRERKALEFLKVEYKVKRFIEDILNIKLQGNVSEAAKDGYVVEFLNFLRPPPVKYNKKPKNNYHYIENINFFNSICLDKEKFGNCFSSVDVVDAASVTKPISMVQVLNNLFRIIRYVQINDIIVKPFVKEGEIPEFEKTQIESAAAIIDEVEGGSASSSSSGVNVATLLDESKKEEELAKKQAEEEEAARKKREEEEEAKRQKEDEAAKKKREAEEEAARKKEEEARRKEEEEEEAWRKKQELEEIKQREEFLAQASKEGKNIGVLRIISGKVFCKRDLFGAADPFVVIKVGKAEKKTRTIRKTLEPKWNEKFTLYNIAEKDAESVTLSLYDWNRILRNEFIGSMTLSLLDYRADEPETITLPLYGKKGKIEGSLLIEVSLQIGATFTAPPISPRPRPTVETAEKEKAGIASSSSSSSSSSEDSFPSAAADSASSSTATIDASTPVSSIPVDAASTVTTPSSSSSSSPFSAVQADAKPPVVVCEVLQKEKQSPQKEKQVEKAVIASGTDDAGVSHE